MRTSSDGVGGLCIPCSTGLVEVSLLQTLTVVVLVY